MMGQITEYVSKLFFVCIAAVICDLICDNSTSSKSNQAALRVVCSLCVCITVFSFVLPDGNLFNRMNDVLDDIQYIQTDNGFAFQNEKIIENTRITLENNLSSAIFQNYGIKPANVSIEFNVNNHDGMTDVTVKSAEILMPSSDRDTLISSVKAFTESVLGCDVNVKGE